MPKRKTNAEFRKQVFDLVGDEYEFLEPYQGRKFKIWVRHNKCKRNYKTTPDTFLCGSRCPYCARKINSKKHRKSPEQFAKEVFKLVGNEYTFLEPYKGVDIKIKVKHNLCGNIYEVTPDNFLRGRRCPYEMTGYRKQMTEKINKKLAIKHLQLVHSYSGSAHRLLIFCQKCHLYFYSYYYSIKDNSISCPFCHKNKMVSVWDEFMFKKYLAKETKNEYKLISSFDGVDKPIKLLHIKCGHIYKVRPAGFIRGFRCAFCRYKKLSQKFRMSQENFAKRMQQKHGNEYEILGKYINAKTKIKFLHRNCGRTFYTVPYSILNGTGCPYCCQSHGEKFIAQYLKKHYIKYNIQKRFENCRNKRSLPFDFYLPTLKTCIEFDGQQHYEPIDFFGGQMQFDKQQQNDAIKDNFCQKHHIRLIRIRYDQNVNEVLNHELKPIKESINYKQLSLL